MLFQIQDQSCISTAFVFFFLNSFQLSFLGITFLPTNTRTHLQIRKLLLGGTRGFLENLSSSERRKITFYSIRTHTLRC